MGNKKNQKAVPFSFIELSLIDKSDFNPRKNFDENELSELSLSIKEKGVIQPIVVRPKGERFEVVCGERRYRASLLAGVETIPACVRELSDEDAEEFAITENLQRKDVAPLEEAAAFSKLMEKGKYDVSALVVKFGKSEAFIRGRIKLLGLNQQFAQMLEENLINIGVANILATCDKDLQESIYKEHYNSNCQPYFNWTNYRSSQLQRAIENTYSTSLKEYFFDMDECKNCPFNSSAFSLFSHEDEGGKCLKRSCITEKNDNYVYDAALKLQEENPNLSLCRDTSWSTNSAAVARLVEDGHEVVLVNLSSDYSLDEPIKPNKEDYENDEDYEDAMKDFEEEEREYDEAVAERNECLQNGELRAFIQIESKKVRIAYGRVKDIVEKRENALESESEKPSSDTLNDSMRLEISKLEKKIQRNDEICNEKIGTDQKEFVKKMKVVDTNLVDIEWALLYRFLIRNMDEKAFAKLGLDMKQYKLEYEDLLTLSENQKALIIRAFIMSNLSEICLPISKIMQNNPLRAFLDLHEANQVREIDSKWQDYYKKRNDRLEERIVAMQKGVEKDEVIPVDNNNTVE